MHIQIDSRQTSLSKFYFSDQIVPNMFDFECKYCKKLFSESKKLQRHEKENCRIRKERVGALKKSRIEFVVLDDCDDAVVPNYEQKLVCNVCNQKFKRQSNMVVHKRRKHMIW